MGIASSKVKNYYSNPLTPPVSPLPVRKEPHKKRKSGRKSKKLVPNSTHPTERVPTIFKWTHGGKDVFVQGNWNDWETKIPLSKSGNDFSGIIELPPGLHQYQFIVDGQVRHAPEQSFVPDRDGKYLNCLEVKEFREIVGVEGLPVLPDSPPGSYSQDIPAVYQQMTGKEGNNNHSDRHVGDSQSELIAYDIKTAKSDDKAPPSLPPYLLRPLLNATDDSRERSKGRHSTLLPIPHSVLINHLVLKYSMDAVLMMGITRRVKAKFVTVVYFTPHEPEEEEDSETLSDEQAPLDTIPPFARASFSIHNLPHPNA